jgi:hypothetical protein
MSNDMAAFAAAKIEARGVVPSPMFDLNYGNLTNKAFWICVRDQDNRVVGLNAYRLDFIDTTLADWVVGWMSGLYMKAGLLMVPEHLQPTRTSKSHQLSGWLCYHGELWLEKATRGPRDVGEAMTLAGHMLALLKWQPDALWALVDQRVGLRGIGILNGYPHAERSFLQWAWRPEDISENEWLLVAESHELQQAAEDRLNLGLISTPG